MDKLLSYDKVEISYGGKTVVRDVSFSLEPGEILGIVGESGSGKSSVIRAAAGILGTAGKVSKGDISFQGSSLLDLPEKELRKIRGAQIGMIFQNAAASLCPVRTIGDQICECMSAHRKMTKGETRERAGELFRRLGLPDTERILGSYPFELSGGMNQRVGIAAAMLLDPALILADEPTSALDVTSQKKVLEEMRMLREVYGTAIILVTHNMGVLSALADTVLVLRQGRIEEYGGAEQVLNHPRAEYTKELLAAVPGLKRAQRRM